MSAHRADRGRRRHSKPRSRVQAARGLFARPGPQLLLAGLAALVAGGLAGALLWFLAGPHERAASLAPPLVTEGGGRGGVDRLARSLASPKSAPILAPDWDSLRSEARPTPSGDQIAELIGRQEGLYYEEALPEEVTAPREISEPNDAEINAALAALDLASFVPAGVTSGDPPAWRRHAVPTLDLPDRPAIAVVIDDLGLNRPNTHRTLALPAPLTLAFLTYAEDLQPLADAARSAGHELLVHVPMAPLDPRYNPGPNVLRADFGREELARRLAWDLSRFDGYVGINNHMGSGFTTSVPGMAQVMMELKARGLLYLDSVTVPDTVGAALAERLGVPFAKRNVFIDNNPRDRAAIRRQLARLEQIAARYGRAVGIGHPHDATLDELTAWLPEVQKRGFRLVPISALVRQGRGLAVTPEAVNAPG